MSTIKKRRFNPFQIIILGFLALILFGALLLTLPIAARDGMWTPFFKALFTATSATCVTGLVVYDVATHFSAFGQVVILLLIQAGGLGLVTIGGFLALLAGRRPSLRQRSTIREAIAAPSMGSVIQLTRFIVAVTLVIEALGALIMMPTFVHDFGLRGIWMAIFHAVSAFCNAGFDVLGSADAPFQSLTAYVGNPIVNLTIMLLIIAGGIGFVTWDDIYTNKWHIRKYSMQSKVILTTTAALVFVPALLFFLFDLTDLPLKERILASLFQSVTMRTAGFNTISLAQMATVSQLLCILLMLVGGSPGSTAGGMKTTTFTVLLANAVATFTDNDEIELFNRSIDNKAVRNAGTLLIMYLTLFLTGGVAISLIDHVSLQATFYEVASALGTVGVTLGITRDLGQWSQFILILFMFFGRVGGLTLIYSTLSRTRTKRSKYPRERITIG